MLKQGRADTKIRGIRKNGATFYKHIVLAKGIDEEASVLGHYCFMQDITGRKLIEQKLLLNAFEEANRNEAIFNDLADILNFKHGNRFFYDLAKHIQKISKANYVVIGEVLNSNQQTIQSLAICHEEKFIDQIEYPLIGAPCEKVLNKMVYSCSSNVQNEYPDFGLLKTIQAESYVGAPLFDSNGESIGIIAIL